MTNLPAQQFPLEALSHYQCLLSDRAILDAPCSELPLPADTLSEKERVKLPQQSRRPPREELV